MLVEVNLILLDVGNRELDVGDVGENELDVTGCCGERKLDVEDVCLLQPLLHRLPTVTVM
jgi:hypothetical protein